MMRMTGRRISAYTIFGIAVTVALVVMNIAIITPAAVSGAFTQHYYVAVGDSLSFGYQPNLDFSHGFADDLFADLQRAEVTSNERNHTALENYACAGETSATMINGGCRGRDFLKIPYSGAQLDAVIAFMLAHKGQISPVTFEIGANDVLPDWNAATCTASSATDDHIAQVDHNLTYVDTSTPDAANDPNNTANGILQRLTTALAISPPLPGIHGPANTQARPGDLVMLNYYNPFAKVCSDSAAFVKKLNDHLAADAAKFGVPIVDVYTAFGGDAGMAGNICNLTWYCQTQPDIHPTRAGYQVIAAAVKGVLGYPGVNPGPKMAPPLTLGAAPIAYRREFEA
ncbi:MAG TPA: SGNH/GDSL hydrolase family protein [Ktedonobacterales bacterium]|jgi:lysophospholipase L1-like esterase